MTGRFRWLHPKAIWHDLLALDDRPHAIAAGAAVGMWLGLTPTVGAQMVLVVALAWATCRLVYFNRTAALLAVYVTNPLTIVPVYWFNYRVGTAILGGESAGRDEMAAALDYEGLSGWWDTVTDLAQRYGVPLLVGSLIVATVATALTYPLVLWTVRRLRAEEGQATAEADKTSDV